MLNLASEVRVQSHTPCCALSQLNLAAGGTFTVLVWSNVSTMAANTGFCRSLVPFFFASASSGVS
jgi:hypothetical protein